MTPDRNMKISTLFNPFTRIAGWQALLIGAAIMALTALAGQAGNVMFDGVLDVHVGQHTPEEAFAMQGVNLLATILCLGVAGALVSRSKWRISDVAGVAALSRAPMLIVALAGMAGLAQQGFSSALVAFLLLCLVAGIWMVALMYNGYRVAFNVKGARAVISFIVALVAAETLSKCFFLFVLFGAPASASVAPASIPEGQTIRQTAEIVVDAFQKGDYATVTAYFDDRMKKAVSPTKMKFAWEAVEGQFGPLKSADTNVEESLHESYRILLIPCIFEKGEINLQLAFDDAGRISGLYFK